MSKGLNQWKNTLTPAQIAEGMNAAHRNALRLVEDAEILFASARYPSAASLAILSIEESGKTGILREIAMAKDGRELKQAWKSYRSHTSKNVCWVVSDFVAGGARKIEDFVGLFSEDADHPKVLDNLKQVALYTDCLGRANWSIPEEVIDEKCASSMIRIAKQGVSDKHCTPREIELWIYHFKPVCETDAEGMKMALRDWHKAMIAEGLREEDPYFDLFLGL